MIGASPRFRHFFMEISRLAQAGALRQGWGMGFGRIHLTSGLFAVLALSACGPTQSPIASAPQSYIDEPRSDKEISGKLGLTSRIAHFARLYQIPESLIHRSVRRESNYNSTAKNGPYWGLMQIRHDTARSMGYEGAPSGLLDAETNLTYAVPYLANAYMLSNGDEARAIKLYASGYYTEAKRRGMLGQLHKTAKK
ncbi:MAG: transglycosylase SLT domain-containing protein [Methylocystis sp.]